MHKMLALDERACEILGTRELGEFSHWMWGGVPPRSGSALDLKKSIVI